MPDRQPVIISGRPAWAGKVDACLADRAFAIQSYATWEGLVSRLVDDRAAALLVDAALADWPRWVTTAKTSPATRRIPIVVVGEGDAVSVQAHNAGADVVLAPAELAARLPDLLAAKARVLGSDAAAHLAGQCADPLPPEALAGIRLFNDGEYYRQHDVFEALWMAESGPVRDLYRAILQVGVAYYQIQRGNRRGALKMLLRAEGWLARLPDVCRGVDVAALRRDAGQVRGHLLQSAPEDVVLHPVRMKGAGHNER